MIKWKRRVSRPGMMCHLHTYFWFIAVILFIGAWAQYHCSRRSLAHSLGHLKDRIMRAASYRSHLTVSLILIAIVVSTRSRSLDSGDDVMSRHVAPGNQSMSNLVFDANEGDRRQQSQLLKAVLDSLERGLAFMMNNVHNLNLDAIIGTRIVEGLCCRECMMVSVSLY